MPIGVESILFGIGSVVAVVCMLFFGMLSFILLGVGKYRRSALCAVSVLLVFLFFFGHELGIPKCLGFC